jgi:hypothetical protein
MIQTQSATVFVGARRRYFTRGSAERSFAVEAIRNRCECCNGDNVTPPYTCKYHALDGRKFNRMVALYVAMFVRPSSPVQLKAAGVAQ